MISCALSARMRFAWYHRVVPLLQEYFYNDGERLRAVLGKAFVTEQRPEAGLFEAAPESFDADVPRFEINKFEGDDVALKNTRQGQIAKITRPCR